jgi:gamma-glutamylcyclotransferase (GGCT)/AIG2-like uncharacterized protein YtfP
MESGGWNKRPDPNEPTPTTPEEVQVYIMKYKPRPMERKVLWDSLDLPKRESSHIFLYGTLMDPEQLRKVLQLEHTPSLQPATTVNWKIMLWGQYPALVFKPGNITHGMAYEVQKESQMESHLDLLKTYETEAYKVQGCVIKFGNGRETMGKTFVYNGDENLLKEGSFDLKDWQMEQLDRKAFIEKG